MNARMGLDVCFAYDLWFAHRFCCIIELTYHKLRVILLSCFPKEVDIFVMVLLGSSLLEKQPVESSPSENGTSTSTQSPEDAVKKTQQLIESLCLKPAKVDHQCYHSMGFLPRSWVLYFNMEFFGRPWFFLILLKSILSSGFSSNYDSH